MSGVNMFRNHLKETRSFKHSVMMIKKKVLNSQIYDNLITQNYDPFLAKIISARELVIMKV